MLESRIYAKKIGQCESKEEYERLVQEHQKLYTGWKDYIVPLLHRKNLSAKQVSEGCNVSISCANRFARMIPSKRENVIMLAMMLQLSVEETNLLLMRWAKFQKLYSKNPEDAIWIYLLERGGSQYPYRQFTDYYSKYLELHKDYLKKRGTACASMTTSVAFDYILDHANSKPSIAEQDSEASNDLNFIMMITRLLPSFEDGYQKLISYINSMFYDIGEEDDLILGLDKINKNRHRQKNTPNILFQNNKGWLDLYYRKIRELEKKHRLPSRTFLICLGIHFTMDTDQINYLLSLAGMGMLCPKDRLEGSVVFYLEELYCQLPSYFFKPDYLRVDSFFNELQDYSSFSKKEPKLEEQRNSGVDLPEYIHLDIDDIPTETLSDYIKRRIEETNIFEKDDKMAVQQFLNML